MLDLGVWFDEKLSFSEHIQAKINKAYMMLGIIKRNFKHLTVPTYGGLRRCQDTSDPGHFRPKTYRH